MGVENKGRRDTRKPDATSGATKEGTKTPRAGGRARDDRLPAGLGARRLAVSYIRSVVAQGGFLDDAVAAAMSDEDVAKMDHRDRAMARLVAATVLRRAGQIDEVLRSFLEKPLKTTKGNIWPILQAAAAQLLFLETKPHAAINIAVTQCRKDKSAHRFAGLANAVLRKVATDGPAMIAGQDAARLNTPDWMWERWTKAYGEVRARDIAVGNLREAPLDLTLKDMMVTPGSPQSSATAWAEKLGGITLPTGSIRLTTPGRIEDLEGFADGAWWVQDAAAALPARLLGDIAGKRIADLCAAPGGKTAQLAAAGGLVTAVDSSAKRFVRLRQNLDRLNLKADIVQADAATWTTKEPYDGVILDAPCTATGTMRRHPDIAHLKHKDDINTLVKLQERMLRNAIKLVAPGGLLIYCTCSLEPEEGSDQIERLLQDNSHIERVPVRHEELVGDASLGSATWITAEGDLRTFPYHMDEDNLPNGATVASDAANGDPANLDRRCQTGMDGFYAARLRIKK